MTPSKFKDTLGEILFMHFEVPSLVFAPAHVVSLFTLGISTALVLDCGYTEALVLPVYEGFTILGAWQSGPLGGKRIHRDLEIQLRQSAYLVDDSSREQEGIPFGNEHIQLSESRLEDIKGRFYLSPLPNAMRHTQCAPVLSVQPRGQPCGITGVC
uniref:Actin-related protein 10 n=1 Tax=Schistocephalus solidus TaxID=70667 RepID=A0A0X3P783_SCHSO